MGGEDGGDPDAPVRESDGDGDDEADLLDVPVRDAESKERPTGSCRGVGGERRG